MLKPLTVTAALALVAGTTAAGTGLTRVEIDTEITIAAPVEAVWATLADLRSYPDWNPYHVRVDGPLEQGGKLTVQIEKPNGKSLSIRPHVMEVVPHRSLVWGGGLRGIFHGEHRFDLEPVGAHCTRLSHTEVFSGLFVRTAALDAIEPGYRAMNRALKDHLEQGRTPGAC